MSPFCDLCGKESASIYFIFEKWSSESKNSPYCFLCDECRKKLILLTKYFKNRTLYLHRNNYDTINDNFLNEEKKEIVLKRTFFINFNPLRVISASNYKNGNGILKKDACALCGSRDNLTTHHRYKRSVFGENNDRVITLCEECHKNLENEIRKMEIYILDEIRGIYLFLYKLLFFKKINFEDYKYYTIFIHYKEGRYYFILKNN